MADSNDEEEFRNAMCSFCGKGHEEVEKLIAGPGVYICNICVEVTQGILKKEMSPRRNLKPNWDRLEAEADLLLKMRDEGEIDSAVARKRLIASMFDLLGFDFTDEE